MEKKLLYYLLILVFLFGCKTNDIKGKRLWISQPNAIPFKEYLIANKVSFNETNDSIYETKHYCDFLAHETRTRLEKNPFLKLNKVYAFYSTTKGFALGTILEAPVETITFVIYSDEETIFLGNFDLKSKEFSKPENGIIKIKGNVIVRYFGHFEINNNSIKTRKTNITPFKEWVDCENGIIKNDTIFFKEWYIGNKNSFKKKWWASRHKSNSIEIYQPNLKVDKYIGYFNTTCYSVTGEFFINKKN